VTTWEDLWNQWTDEEEPLSLSGQVANFIRSVILESVARRWTAEMVQKEVIFVRQCLELWIIRCQAAHDRLLDKPKTSLFAWLQDTTGKVVTGELTFQTSNGKDVVLEALQRQMKYSFKKQTGK
jgi:hypothetical protein